MSEWDALVAAMAEYPDDVLLMKVAADWLQEHGDPRWECLAWMAEHGKTGDSDNGFYWYLANDEPALSGKWHSTVADDWWSEAEDTDLSNVIAARIGLLNAWAKADEGTRRRWMAESLPELEAEMTHEG